MTYFEARKWAFSIINENKEVTEADVEFLLKKQFGFSNTDLLIHLRDSVKSDDLETFQNNVRRLVAGEPPQYVVGEADFYGLELLVDSRVLIPRVETEELVEWVLTDIHGHDNPSILDVGTGSGAIALAIKANCPLAKVNASDISADALNVAMGNADKLKLAIDFIKSDLFDSLDDRFDVIVSNPPYISHGELGVMDSRVKEYEPRLALFADDDGLKVYKRLAEHVADYLNPGGKLYLEIGYHQEDSVKQIFTTKYPEAEVTGKHDMAGNQRMIKVTF